MKARSCIWRMGKSVTAICFFLSTLNCAVAADSNLGVRQGNPNAMGSFQQQSVASAQAMLIFQRITYKEMATQMAAKEEAEHPSADFLLRDSFKIGQLDSNKTQGDADD